MVFISFRQASIQVFEDTEIFKYELINAKSDVIATYDSKVRIFVEIL